MQLRRVLIIATILVSLCRGSHAQVQPVQSYDLNSYVPTLEGQWEGIRYASDGNVYFASSTNDAHHGAAFFKFDPRTNQLTVLAPDITVICGENPYNNPQGKIHSDIVEANGWLYFSTHFASDLPGAYATWTGSHLIGYQLATGIFRDYGVVDPNYDSYSAVGVDPVRNYVYIFVTGEVNGRVSYLFRIDAATGHKTNLGAVGTVAACLWMFVDQRGDVWFSPEYGNGTLYRAHGDSNQIDVYPNELPQVYLWNANQVDPNAGDQAGRYIQWMQPLDGNRALFTLAPDGGMLYMFDSSQPIGSGLEFTNIQFIGYNYIGMALGNNRVFWYQRANNGYGHQGDDAPPGTPVEDFHLMSVSLDPATGYAITDHGLIQDQNGRLVWRVPSMMSDGHSRVFMAGDWWINSGDVGTLEYNYGNGVESYGPLNRGEFFAVASHLIQDTLTIQSTPATGAPITGTISQNTNSSLTLDDGTAVSLTAPTTFTSGSTTYSFDHWLINGITQAGNTLSFTLNANSTAVAIYNYLKTSTVAVSPQGRTLYQGQSQQFAATVQSVPNQPVTWSLNPSLGTLSPSGLYTAPTTITTAQVVIITTTSATDSTQYATAIITLEPPISVSTTPASVTLGRYQSQQFIATVQNSTDQSVTWALSPPVGTISATGLYVPPTTIMSQQTVTVTATSTVDESKFGNATINLVAGASASFVSYDTTTQGNWQATYGAGGYSIPNAGQGIPSYATLAVQNQTSYTWVANAMDVRAPFLPGNTTQRIASTWYSSPSFTLDLNLTDGALHQFALYGLDWDDKGRIEVVKVLDALSNAVLDTRTFSRFSSGAYLVWNLVGHVRITVTAVAGPNAVLSGAFFGGGGSGASASFVVKDSTTQGNWKTAYGAEGYLIANASSQLLPGYASSFAVQNQSNHTWVASTSDARALVVPDDSSQRIAATWYNTPTFTFDLNMTDGNLHQVALYALDWDAGGRVETVQIRDAGSNALLSAQTISSFSSGVYLVWNITGHVSISVTGNSGANAAVSGAFFGGAKTSAGSPALGITKTHTGNFTQGQQNATYTVTVSNSGNAPTSGAVTVMETIPPGLTLVSMAGTGWICPASGVTCTRSEALNAGSSYPPIAVTVNVAANATPTQVNQVSVSGGGSAGANASDSTTITVVSGGGSDATASFLAKDTTTQGNWQTKYGGEGYSLATITPQSIPGYGLFSVTNGSSYTWVASTSDVRALLLPSSTSQRTAVTWFNGSTFSMNVNVAGQHQVALYALDWDNGGRTETVKVVDAANANNVLDTETLSGFSGGVYLVWNITGNVNITITASTGNAVMSGVFFGTSNSNPTPLLGITKRHTGNFTQGQQNATYNVTVSNSGNAASSGTVTVTETAPPGLTLVSMAGTGWNCPANGNTCTRNDELNVGSSYLPITVTMNVVANSSSPQVNQAGVSGGGSAGANASDSTIITALNTGGTAAQFVKLDTTTHGNWTGVYGTTGYSLASVASPTMPSYATLAVQNQANYTWAASTSDARALLIPGSISQRTAATWYNLAPFSFDLNFSDGSSHSFALYALDWDSGGRAETVQIFDAVSNASLDKETLSNFSGGAYLVWNITGHVKIVVTLNNGANAVISAAFFN